MEDRSYWAFSKTGNFTVRSCYHHLLEHKGRDADGVPSSTSSPSLLLNWIWDLKVPPKIRMFLWRSCHEIIPTKAVLVRRHVGTNPYFEFCSNAIETATHLFFQCPTFAELWRGDPFNLSTRTPVSNFMMGFQWLRSKLDVSTFGLACVVLWNVWNLRNGVVHWEDGGDRDWLVA